MTNNRSSSSSARSTSSSSSATSSANCSSSSFWPNFVGGVGGGVDWNPIKEAVNATAATGLRMPLLLLLVVASLSILLFINMMKSRRRRNYYNNNGSRRNITSTKHHQHNCRRLADVAEGEANKRKQEFLARIPDDVYGYRNSEAGFIDDWRPREFPQLLLPLGSDGNNDRHHGRNHHEPTSSQETQEQEPEVYLDYAGSALPWQSQLTQVYHMYRQEILANPHSTGPAASRTFIKIQTAEQRVLRFLHALPGRHAYMLSSYGKQEEDERQQQPLSGDKRLDNNEQLLHQQLHHGGYELVWTSGATEGFARVAERFPWGRGRRRTTDAPTRCRLTHSSTLVYVTQSHNSVTGMRHLALQHDGVVFRCLDLYDLERMTVEDFQALFLSSSSSSKRSSHDNEAANRRNDENGGDGGYDFCRCRSYNLLVFPAECNFGGDWPVDVASIIRKAREGGFLIMLDIAKAASTGPVNLTEWDPDFASLSFYKLFGEPTGLGALLVKRDVAKVLMFNNDDQKTIRDDTKMCRRHRHYQGGGSVDVMIPGQDYTVPKEGLNSLASGSIHFRGISALTLGFDCLDKLGGMDNIHKHTTCLAMELTRRLRALKHHEVKTAIKIYGTWGDNDCLDTMTSRTRGPTVAFNIVRNDDTIVGYNEVSKLAALNRPPIQFRTGCFCNPGACQKALGMSDEEAIDNFESAGHSCGDHIDLVDGRPTGAVRVSFGKDSLWEDMDVLVKFIEETFVDMSQPEISKVVEETQTQRNGPATVSISELYIFPIKSCSAQRVRKWPTELPSGKLKYDREFALVDTSGTALRLQTCPKLHLISPVINLETQTMTVSAPGVSDLVVNLDGDSYHGGENVVQVCGNKCGGRVWGEADVAEWFSTVLGMECWLARYSVQNLVEGTNKESSSSSSSSEASNVRPNGFSNEQPILLISEHAVSALNQVMADQGQEPVGSRRFRPNIVVKAKTWDRDNGDTDPRHIEDDWSTVSLLTGGQQNNGDVGTSDRWHGRPSSTSPPNMRLSYQVKGGCPRCTMVDYDPATGHKGQTLRALAKYRRRNGRIVFGIFLKALSPSSSHDKEVIDDGPDDQVIWISEGDVLECT